MEFIDRYQGDSDRMCRNGLQFAICNWSKLEGQDLCYACSFNRVIPNLDWNNSIPLWSLLELAKRRALYGMLRENLYFEPWHLAKSNLGLAFEFKSSAIEPVTTGYADGVITINLLEADDVEREKVRASMGESYRTLLGHFRHELGHYFWDKFFRDHASFEHYREEFCYLFGDIQVDYQESLNRHYQSQTSDQNFDSEHYISQYATAHPSEDWAETWAHYWHILDATDTCENFGISPNDSLILNLDELFDNQFISRAEEDVSVCDFLQRIGTWIQLSPALNELAGSLGYNAIYPFALTATVVRKLSFAHRLIHDFRSKSPLAFQQETLQDQVL